MVDSDSFINEIEETLEAIEDMERVEEELWALDTEDVNFGILEWLLRSGFLGDLNQERDTETLTMKMTLWRLYESIEDSFELMNDIEEFGDEHDLQVFGQEDFQQGTKAHIVTDEILTFFVVSSEYLRKISLDLAYDELVTERYQGSNQTKHLFEVKMSQEMVESLLLRCGVVDQDLQSRIARVRKLRNRLVHNPAEWYFLENMNLTIENIDRCLETINEVSKKAYGHGFIED